MRPHAHDVPHHGVREIGDGRALRAEVPSDAHDEVQAPTWHRGGPADSRMGARRVARELPCCGVEARVGEDRTHRLVVGNEVAFLLVSGPPQTQGAVRSTRWQR